MSEGIERLQDLPEKDIAALRVVYGDQLDRVFDSDEDLDNEEPQDHEHTETDH